MELSIIRRETTGAGIQKYNLFGWEFNYRTVNNLVLAIAPNQYNESETITKFEIMDGAPVRGKL